MELQGQAQAQPSIMERMQSIADQALVEDGQLVKVEDKPATEAATPEKDAEPTQAESEAETPEAKTEEESQPQKFKLKVKAEDGSDVEVEEDIEGLKKGYMLEKAFRQKTAQLARQREAVQEEAKKAVETKLKEYDDKLALAEQVIWHTLAPEMQTTDWNKLAAEDPAAWAQKFQHVQNVNAKLAQVQAERQKIAQAQAEEQRKSIRQQITQAVETLQTEIPGWGSELYGKILETGKKYGYKAEEVNAITDPRAIKVLHDAMQYRLLKAKPLMEKRAAAEAPKVVKPGTTEKTDPKADKWNEARARLKKSGSKEDAVAAMMHFVD